MTKRARPTATQRVPMDLLDAVYRVPWSALHLTADSYPGFWAQFDQLRQRRAYIAACADALRRASAAVRATDWPTASGDMLTAAVEGLLHADRGAEQCAPFLLGLETRARRQLYTAGWLVRCWERGVSPEPLLCREGYRPGVLRSQASDLGVFRTDSTLTVELTGKCVYDCPWCTSRNRLTQSACACGRWDDGGPALPLERLLSAVEDLSLVGVSRLVVKGGEPLLEPDRLWGLIDVPRGFVSEREFLAQTQACDALGRLEGRIDLSSVIAACREDRRQREAAMPTPDLHWQLNQDLRHRRLLAVTTTPAQRQRLVEAVAWNNATIAAQQRQAGIGTTTPGVTTARAVLREALGEVIDLQVARAFSRRIGALRGRLD